MPMHPYIAPLDDIRLAIRSLGKLEVLCEQRQYQHAGDDLLHAVLEEAGRFAAEILDPINSSGDECGCSLIEGEVETPPGMKAAYTQFVTNGWNTIDFPAYYGGQELPRIIHAAISEMWSSANMAFGLCPLLTHGAVELLLSHGTEDQKSTYLHKLVSGEWTGTMCMTEPEAGSDVGAVRTTATPDGDAYRIQGTKIFITFGEHDMAENIIHLVLARLPDAPEGSRGLSLFIVPKFLPNADGSLGERNDVTCLSLEHKLGIHASPTAVLSFGDNDGAIGYLVGEMNGGLKAMFTMMNSARLGVGIEGLAITERASQMANYYATERTQSRSLHPNIPNPAPIIYHPDVELMVDTISCHAQALRGIAYLAATALDMAEHAESEELRQEYAHMSDFLTPIVKAHATQVGFDCASLCLQVYGGMGYIEESGVPQLLRDARIALIYEGTNGIQGLDLVMRKLDLDEGAYVFRLIHDMRHAASNIPIDTPEDVTAMAQAAFDCFENATRMIQSWSKENKAVAAYAATAYTRLAGLMMELHVFHCHLSDEESGFDPEIYHFFIRQILPEILSLAARIHNAGAYKSFSDSM